MRSRYSALSLKRAIFVRSFFQNFHYITCRQNFYHLLFRSPGVPHKVFRSKFENLLFCLHFVSVVNNVLFTICYFSINANVSRIFHYAFLTSRAFNKSRFFLQNMFINFLKNMEKLQKLLALDRGHCILLSYIS